MKVRNPNQFKTLINDTGRVCTKCGVFKLWDLFSSCKTKKIATKRSSECKRCKKEKRKVVGRIKERFSAKKRAAEIRTKDIFLSKARALRNGLLRRYKESKNTTPTTQELYQWFKSSPLICYYSGVPLNLLKKSNDKLTVDHKLPVGRGGTNELSNLCFASHHMNTAKGSMTEYEFKQLLQLIHTWEDKGKKLLTRLKQGHF